MDLANAGQGEPFGTRARYDHHLDVLSVSIALIVVKLFIDTTHIGSFGTGNECISQSFGRLWFLGIETFITIALQDTFKRFRTRVRTKIAVEQNLPG
tara:strand:- start:318 stop:608 length:291 start_codon:yes stop_codon:yes gene_type:complete